ncbi:MAG: ABC transporter substrate-binding protein [Mycobacterium sp.]|nr:ABC transporter substrate-binding protein [Mycobacterium sp.]
MSTAAGGVLVSACTAPGPQTAPTPVSNPQPLATGISSGSAVGATPGRAAQSAGQPRTGGKLRFAMATDLDQGVEAARLGNAYTPSVFMMFDTLTVYDAQRQPQPLLAESWDWSTDNKTLKLNLRQGITFHSGREFTSDDVKYNVLRVREPAHMQLGGMSAWYTIDTPDKYTVILNSDQPRPLAFDFLEYLNITDRDLAESSDAKTTAGGTGPFKLVEWVSGDHVSFMKNTNYWQAGKPYLDEVNVAIVKDPEAMSLQLDSGALDAIYTPPLQNAGRWQQDSNFQVLVDDPNGYFFTAAVNVAMPPFDNKTVRQAINYGIDRKRFADTILLKLGGPGQDLPWPAGAPADEPSKQQKYAFDLDKASSLLAEAGVSDLTFDLTFLTIPPELGQLAQIFASDLEKIGVKLNLVPLETPAYLARTAAHNFQITLQNALFSHMEPGTMFNLSGLYRPAPDGTTGFGSDQYRQLITASQNEPDPAKRKQVFSDLNDLFLDECFVMPLALQPVYIVARNNVANIKWRINQAPMFSEMWLQP